MDHAGQGLQTSGKIYNDNGVLQGTFRSDANGTAPFFMNAPVFGEMYFAVIHRDTFKLPAVKSKGISIRTLHSFNSKEIQITVLSRGVSLKNGSIVIHNRGKLLLKEKCTSEDAFAIRLKKELLEYGLLHVTFFNQEKIPVSERLIFPNLAKTQPTVVLHTDKDFYDKRSQVSLTIAAAQEVHSASITISPEAESPYAQFDENIRNYLLLSSEFEKKIYSPGFYFVDNEESYRAMDLLMISKNWTRFDWESLASWKKEFNYFQEDGISLKGQVISLSKTKKTSNLKVGLSVPSHGILNETFTPSADGSFVIMGLKLYDSTEIYLQALQDREGKQRPFQNSKILLRPKSRPNISEFTGETRIPSQYFVKKAKMLDQIAKAYFMDNEAIFLDEVAITTKRQKQKEIDTRTLHSEPSNRLLLDSICCFSNGQTAFDILQGSPGVAVTSNQSVIIRGKEASYFLDGMTIDKQFIKGIPLENIDFIDVLKGPEAGIYGVESAVLVYTRLGRPPTKPKQATGVLAFTHPGYHRPKEFKSPNYDFPEEDHVIPDFRTTLYWNPEVQFNDLISDLSFHTSDQDGRYLVRIEGIFSSGEPFFSESHIEVK